MGNVRTGLSLTKAIHVQSESNLPFCSLHHEQPPGRLLHAWECLWWQGGEGRAVAAKSRACLPAACPLKNQSSCFHRIVMTVDFA